MVQSESAPAKLEEASLFNSSVGVTTRRYQITDAGQDVVRELLD